MDLKTFLNHGTSYTRFPVLSSLRVTGLWREVYKPLGKPYQNPEKMIITQNQKAALVHPPQSF